MNRKTANDALQAIGKNFSNRKIGEINDMESLTAIHVMLKIGLIMQFVIYVEAIALFIILAKHVENWGSYEKTIGTICTFCIFAMIFTMFLTAKTLLEPKFRLVKKWKRIREFILKLGDEALEKAINTYHHETPEECYALWERNVLEQIGRAREMERSKSHLTERDAIIAAKGMKWLNIIKAEFNSAKSA